MSNNPHAFKTKHNVMQFTSSEKESVLANMPGKIKLTLPQKALCLSRCLVLIFSLPSQSRCRVHLLTLPTVLLLCSSLAAFAPPAQNWAPMRKKKKKFSIYSSTLINNPSSYVSPLHKIIPLIYYFFVEYILLFSRRKRTTVTICIFFFTVTAQPSQESLSAC